MKSKKWDAVQVLAKVPGLLLTPELFAAVELGAPPNVMQALIRAGVPMEHKVLLALPLPTRWCRPASGSYSSSSFWRSGGSAGWAVRGHLEIRLRNPKTSLDDPTPSMD